MTKKASKGRRRARSGAIASGISTAAELIGSNVDLLTEILVRLPAKSLLRFKCVSKHWFSLISHSQFRTNHSIQNPSPSISGLYFYFDSQLNSVSLRRHRNLPSLSFLDGFGEQSRIRVIHSCNGLLLCYNGLFDGHIHRHRLIVCNPTTKEHTILPNSQKSSYNGDAYLAFDPSKSPHYKVIYFGRFSPIDIYCSQSTCWKHVTLQHILWDRGVFWNGAIHWYNYGCSLLRFDVNAEEMIVMSNPQTPKILTRKNTKYFGENGGSLILIQSTSHSPLGFRILELDKDYRGWIVKCRVNLRPLIAAFPELKDRPFWVLKVLPIAKEENERDFTLVLTIPGRIVSYDPKCKTWDVLCNLLVGKSYVCNFNHVYPFIETLSPVLTIS